MVTVNINAVSKSYEKQRILDNVNVHIEKGEFVAVVGPSGCGKSTLLRLVAGLDGVTSGNILIDGKCINRTPPASRDIAMVFQSYALYPHMTAYDNMAYGLKMRGMKKQAIRQRVQEVAQLLQLTDYLNRKPHLLSGGQRQRVAMGRAIVRAPAVFLFDEPLSNLDAKLRTEMRYEIKKLHQELRTTCLYVTHDQTEAMTMADRIVILNKGRVEQVATPQVLYQYPASVFVASFIGHYPMNFLPGKIDLKAGVIETNIGVVFPLPRLTQQMVCGDLVTIGIRPEHLFLTTMPTSNSVLARVEFIDDMGADKVIQVITARGDLRVCVRVSGDTLLTDSQLHLELNMQKANVFCHQTGMRIGDWNE